MTEHFSFFDAIQDSNGHYDREYNAQQFTDYFKSLVTTGVMKGAYNQLEVTVNGSNMTSSVKSGIAFVEGRYYYNDALLQLTHDTEVVGLSRIDRIVVRMDLSTDARYVKTFIKKGVPATSPVPPTLTQTTQLYEISLAQILVVGGQTYIATNAVTDERGKDVICPWAGSKILPNFSDSSVGLPNGIASLDEYGSVPLEQLQNVPLPQDASTVQKGIVQLNNTLTSTSVTEAATANAVKQLNDLKVSKVQQTPIQLTMINGWANANFQEPLKYHKDEFGFVHLYGTVSTGTQKAVGIIPSGYRPRYSLGFQAVNLTNNKPVSFYLSDVGSLEVGYYETLPAANNSIFINISWKGE